jgi:hypothetical protein
VFRVFIFFPVLGVLGREELQPKTRQTRAAEALFSLPLSHVQKKRECSSVFSSSEKSFASFVRERREKGSDDDFKSERERECDFTK